MLESLTRARDWACRARACLSVLQVVPVIALEDAAAAVPLANALLEGGISLMEVC